MQCILLRYRFYFSSPDPAGCIVKFICGHTVVLGFVNPEHDYIFCQILSWNFFHNVFLLLEIYLEQAWYCFVYHTPAVLFIESCFWDPAGPDLRTRWQLYIRSDLQNLCQTDLRFDLQKPGRLFLHPDPALLHPTRNIPPGDRKVTCRCFQLSEI